MSFGKVSSKAPAVFLPYDKSQGIVICPVDDEPMPEGFVILLGSARTYWLPRAPSSSLKLVLWDRNVGRDMFWRIAHREFMGTPYENLFKAAILGDK